MQETQHKITDKLRQEFFANGNQEILNTRMDDRLKELPDETLVRRVKIGRNDTCPCGSGRKFKKCCINKIGQH